MADDIKWQIVVSGMTKRSDARKLATLIRRAVNDNVDGSEDIRVDVQGYTSPELA